MFAYLISKLLCNIYQRLDVCAGQKTCFSGTSTSFGSRETYLESLFKVLDRKIIFYVFILTFISEISLVISLHGYWFTLGALAAYKNCIVTRSKVIFRKVLNGLKEKKIFLESSFKAPDS